MIATAHAGADVATWSGTWHGHDLRVTVLSSERTIDPETIEREPWWNWGNTTTDTYAFGFRDDDGVDLVIQFTSSGDGPTATVSVIREDDRLAVGFDGSGVVLPSTVRQLLTVRPHRGRDAWHVAGEVNFDLDVHQLDPVHRNVAREIRVGASAPGRPAWATYELIDDPQPTWGYPRFGANVLADASIGYDLAEPIMPTWPYLSIGRGHDHYGPNRPLFYDIGSRRLEHFWVGFHVAGMYQFNSLSFPPAVDFESPYAFYRFEPSFGAYPNLVVRSDRWPAESPFGPPPIGTPRTAMRLSWTEDEPGRWRYSFSGIGDQVVDEQISVGDVVLNAIGYDALPSWTAMQLWKAVTFVEATEGEGGSEGLYDYSVEDHYAISRWVSGLADQRPDGFEAPYLTTQSAPYDGSYTPASLREGYRGAYALAYNRVPSLYVSPIDQRVHLAYADGGVWNLGHDHVLRTQNATGDAYIDCWIRERIDEVHAPPESDRSDPWSTRARNGTAVERLCVMDGQILYVGDEHLVIVQTTDRHEATFFPVPHDHTSWRLALLQSGGAAAARDPWHLWTWLDAFVGPRWSIANATVEAVTVTIDGMHVVVGAAEDTIVAGDSSILGHEGGETGRYVIAFDRRSGVWTSEAATPPALTVTLDVDTVRAFHPTTVVLTIDNAGTMGVAAPATLRAGDDTIAQWDELRVGGAGRLEARFAWTPRQPGERLVTLDYGEHALTLGPVTVGSTPRVTGFAALTLSVMGHGAPLALIVLTLLLVGMCCAWIMVRNI